MLMGKSLSLSLEECPWMESPKAPKPKILEYVKRTYPMESGLDFYHVKELTQISLASSLPNLWPTARM